MCNEGKIKRACTLCIPRCQGKRKCTVQYSAHIDKVVVVKVSVCMQFMCEMMHVSVGQELGERVKHTKRLHLQLTIAIY